MCRFKVRGLVSQAGKWRGTHLFNQMKLSFHILTNLEENNQSVKSCGGEVSRSILAQSVKFSFSLQRQLRCCCHPGKHHLHSVHRKVGQVSEDYSFSSGDRVQWWREAPQAVMFSEQLSVSALIPCFLKVFEEMYSNLMQQHFTPS